MLLGNSTGMLLDKWLQDHRWTLSTEGLSVPLDPLATCETDAHEILHLVKQLIQIKIKDWLWHRTRLSMHPPLSCWVSFIALFHGNALPAHSPLPALLFPLCCCCLASLPCLLRGNQDLLWVFKHQHGCTLNYSRDFIFSVRGRRAHVTRWEMQRGRHTHTPTQS